MAFGPGGRSLLGVGAADVACCGRRVSSVVRRCGPSGLAGASVRSVPAPVSRTLALTVRGWDGRRGGILMIAAEVVDYVSPRVVSEAPLFAAVAGHSVLSSGPLRRGVQRVSSFSFPTQSCTGSSVSRVAFGSPGIVLEWHPGSRSDRPGRQSPPRGVGVTSSALSASLWFVSSFGCWRVASRGRLRSTVEGHSRMTSVVVGPLPGVLVSTCQVKALRSRHVKGVCR